MKILEIVKSLLGDGKVARDSPWFLLIGSQLEFFLDYEKTSQYL